MFFVEQNIYGPLAQLVRAFAWHAKGQGFESLMVHKEINLINILENVFKVHKKVY